MKIENDKFNDGNDTQNGSDNWQSDIRSRLRKNPNKTKHLYTDELIEKRTKKKVENSTPLNEKDICRTILEIVKKDEKSFLFRQPAIRAFSSQKDKEYYKKQIKEPRDLGGIAKKLKTPKYSPKEFYEDMELCWSNALLFNEDTTQVYQHAIYLKDLCNKLYKEYGLFDILNKEKEKEIESNTNVNTNDSNTSFNDKNKNDNNKDNKDNKNNRSRSKSKDKSENENPSINSNKSSNNNNTESNNYNDSSYSSELKSNKIIGKKRKRQKHNGEKEKHLETIIKENDEDEENIINHKKGRKKRNKLMNEISDIVPPAQTKKSKNKSSFEDIKKKLPINFPVISELNDLNKISQKRKSNSQNKGNNTKLLTINNSISNNSKNGRTPTYNNNKRKQQSQLQNNNINSISSTNTNSNTNSNGSFNINMIDENDKRRIAYEFIMDIFKSKFPIQNEETQKSNTSNEKNSYFSYDPERFNTENQQLAKYDNNCNYENVHKIETKNQKKKQSLHVDLNKNNFIPNMNNMNMNINNSGKGMNNINNSVKNIDPKEDKKMQLRVEIAKYLDNLTDSNMIELLVFIENIRPQSIRILDNDTIYIDMETFNEETFIKVFEFVKKFV